MSIIRTCPILNRNSEHKKKLVNMVFSRFPELAGIGIPLDDYELASRSFASCTKPEYVLGITFGKLNKDPGYGIRYPIRYFFKITCSNDKEYECEWGNEVFLTRKEKCTGELPEGLVKHLQYMIDDRPDISRDAVIGCISNLSGSEKQKEKSLQIWNNFHHDVLSIYPDMVHYFCGYLTNTDFRFQFTNPKRAFHNVLDVNYEGEVKPTLHNILWKGDKDPYAYRRERTEFEKRFDGFYYDQITHPYKVTNYVKRK